ncbi:MAG: LacI family DNA-binding transcriptional regulator, partial [Sneathiella sp.]
MGKHGRDISLKPTVNDIARVAGVSLATVDRVMNGRPGVRNVTIERVYDAIQELGYVRDTAAANLARGRVYNFQFLLPQSNNEFVTSLEHQIMGISKVMAFERTKISYEKIPAFNPQALASILSRMDPNNIDGVAIFGPETAAVKEAIDQIKKRGMSVIALVSDLPSSERDYFVGID